MSTASASMLRHPQTGTRRCRCCCRCRCVAMPYQSRCALCVTGTTAALGGSRAWRHHRAHRQAGDGNGKAGLSVTCAPFSSCVHPDAVRPLPCSVAVLRLRHVVSRPGRCGEPHLQFVCPAGFCWVASFGSGPHAAMNLFQHRCPLPSHSESSTLSRLNPPRWSGHTCTHRSCTSPMQHDPW